MKIQIRFLAVALLINNMVLASIPPSAPRRAQLTYSVDFVLNYVLTKKGLIRDPRSNLPGLRLSSGTPVAVFQSAISDQWGFSPDFITNAYSVKTNEIFLTDDQDYYDQTKRCIDDSLAHEIAHYVQVNYQHWDLADESLEWDAIDIQNQFREEFCPKHENSRVSSDRH